MRHDTVKKRAEFCRESELSTSQLADLFGVSESTIRAYRRNELATDPSIDKSVKPNHKTINFLYHTIDMPKPVISRLFGCSIRQVDRLLQEV